MKVGYCRISTDNQSIELQVEALLRAGVEERNIFKDVSTGAKKERPGFKKMEAVLRKGDTVIVWRTDRIARSLSHLITTMEGWKNIGVEFSSITEPMIDTTTAFGNAIFQIIGVFAELERNIIIERTNAGLAAAKKQGRTGGRRRGLTAKAKRQAKVLATLYKGGMTIKDMREHTGIKSSATIYKYLEHEGVKVGKLVDRETEQIKLNK